MQLVTELISRQKSWKTQLYLGLVILLAILLHIAGPKEYYTRYGKVDYEGWLSYFNLSEYAFVADALDFLLLSTIGAIFLFFLKRILKITGTITITENKLTVTYFKGITKTFYLDKVGKIDIVFNYFKPNDVEPRHITKANNNSITFYKLGVKFHYEFLLQTQEEDDAFRAFVDTWKTKGLIRNYKTTLADF